MVVVLGVGHLVHPRSQIRAGLIPDLIGQRGVHRSLDRKPLSQIVSAGPSVSRVGLLCKQCVETLRQTLVALGHRPKHRSELGFAVDQRSLGEVPGSRDGGGDLAEAVSERVGRLGAFGIGHQRYSRGPVRAALNALAIRRGAIVCLVIAAPAAVISRLLADDDGGTDQSNWVFVALLAIVVAYLVGGALAGRRAPGAPFVNGAAATFSAFLIVQVIGGVVRLAQGDGLSPLGIVFNGLLAATIGIVGAGIGVSRGKMESGGGEPTG